VVAVATTVAAVALGGIVWPLILTAIAVILPAGVAGVLARLLKVSLLLALPIAVSAVLINVFFFPGGRIVLLQLGPISATAEGLVFALEVVVRVVAMSGAVALFYLTTRPSDLVLDLERRGVSPRVAFIANASVQTVPAMLERASSIVDAQRARGLDTQASLWRRIRGLVPIVGPVVMGSITEVEERTMALEARGFTRPGRRSLLWSPADSRSQQVARWLIVIGGLGVIVARTVGLASDVPGLG
jgi:energy-coupling factor transport system permease protein